jgi:aminopeptidase-like protein
LLGIPPSNRKQQTNSCKYLEETTPWTLSANSSLNLEESLSVSVSLSFADMMKKKMKTKYLYPDVVARGLCGSLTYLSLQENLSLSTESRCQ